ncbi:hypothetical protein [Sinomicrobium oceani]|uniref:hypothetical protein n=1 Tax=Sinomicrobium oceani TaxID=1150368 RepID=UPI00227CBB9C|nr:hypothetical protein [Sinomicrobium oceani]
MYDQYKTNSFDGITLQGIANDLSAAGWNVKTVWKKGNSKRETYGEGVNFFQLEKDGKWVLRQVKNKGFVRMGKMSAEEERLFLSLLKKNMLYSKPEWTLGLVLTIVYAILIFFIGSSRDMESVGIVLFVSALCLFGFLGLAYMRSEGKLSAGLYRVSLVFGIIGYALTALSSLLCLPVMNSIFRNALYTKVKAVKTQDILP